MKVINALMAAGVVLVAAGVSVRFGPDVGAIVTGVVLLVLAWWLVRIKRGR